MQKKNILVSACLLGEKVRYDGTDKRNNFILQKIAPFHHIISFCPEMNMGLGSPRDPLYLVEDSGVIKLFDLYIDDLTEKAKGTHQYYLERLALVDIAILKSKSPSCGHGTTPLSGSPTLVNGLFTEELLKIFPKIKIFDELDLKKKSVQDFFKSL